MSSLQTLRLISTMAARHFLHRGILTRAASVWMPAGRAAFQGQIAMATNQKSAGFDFSSQRVPLVSNPSASFHSSRNLLDENTFTIQDDEDFKDKVLSSDSVVIVDFHAEWCNPCKALTPVLDAALKNTQGQIKLAKVDIDELQDLAIGYGVDSVPTVMAFKGGQKVDKFIGLQPQDKIERFIENLLT